VIYQQHSVPVAGVGGEKKDFVIKDHPDNKQNREKNSNDPADIPPVHAAKRKKQMTFFDEFTRA